MGITSRTAQAVAAWAGVPIALLGAGVAALFTGAGAPLLLALPIGAAAAYLVWEIVVYTSMSRLRRQTASLRKARKAEFSEWVFRTEPFVESLTPVIERSGDPAISSALDETGHQALDLYIRPLVPEVTAQVEQLPAADLRQEGERLARRASALPPGPVRFATRAQLGGVTLLAHAHERYATAAGALSGGLAALSRRLAEPGDGPALLADLSRLRGQLAEVAAVLDGWVADTAIRQPFPRTRAWARCLAVLVLLAAFSLAVSGGWQLLVVLAALPLLLALIRSVAVAFGGRVRLGAAIAVPAMASAVLAAFYGPLAYQSLIGESTPAIVTDIGVSMTDSGVSRDGYDLVEAGTGRDLGIMEIDPEEDDVVIGDGIEVLVDPLGFVAPVPEDVVNGASATGPLVIIGVTLAGLLCGTLVTAAGEFRRRAVPAPEPVPGR